MEFKQQFNVCGNFTCENTCLPAVANFSLLCEGTQLPFTLHKFQKPIKFPNVGLIVESNQGFAMALRLLRSVTGYKKKRAPTNQSKYAFSSTNQEQHVSRAWHRFVRLHIFPALGRCGVHFSNPTVINLFLLKGISKMSAIQITRLDELITKVKDEATW